jgi:hypothetical protein
MPFVFALLAFFAVFFIFAWHIYKRSCAYSRDLGYAPGQTGVDILSIAKASRAFWVIAVGCALVVFGISFRLF